MNSCFLKKSLTILLAVLVLSLAHCGQGTETGNPTTGEGMNSDNDVSFNESDIRSLAQGSAATSMSEQYVIIDNFIDFESLWIEIYADLSEIPATPHIDFLNEVAVFAIMGVQPNGGYRIQSVDFLFGTQELIL